MLSFHGNYLSDRRIFRNDRLSHAARDAGMEGWEWKPYLATMLKYFVTTLDAGKLYRCLENKNSKRPPSVS